LSSEGLGVLGVAIVQQIAAVSQRTAALHGHVAGDLLHPPLIRVNRDPGDVHPAAPSCRSVSRRTGSATAIEPNEQKEIGIAELWSLRYLSAKHVDLLAKD